MNILFFLHPKQEVAYVYDDCTLRQVLETMEHHKYASIPMLNRQGEYVGTITEGDLLWGMKKYTNLNLKEAEHIFIHDFERKALYRSGCRFRYERSDQPGNEPEFCSGRR